MSAQAFREWLLESHTSTGLDVGRANPVRKSSNKYPQTRCKQVLTCYAMSPRMGRKAADEL